MLCAAAVDASDLAISHTHRSTRFESSPQTRPPPNAVRFFLLTVTVRSGSKWAPVCHRKRDGKYKNKCYFPAENKSKSFFFGSCGNEGGLVA